MPVALSPARDDSGTSMTLILAVASQKGGVGKTTTALAIGAAMAEQGRRVLLVDLDPQAGLTSAAGCDPDDLAENVYSAMLDCIEEGRRPRSPGACVHALGANLDLLPASTELAAAELELLDVDRREHVLAEVLAPLRNAYDIVIVDCPPSLSLLTVNALTAAEEVLVPVVPEYLAARGLGLLLDTVERVRTANLNPGLRVAGIVLTMTDYRTTHGCETAQSVRAHLNGRIPVLGEVKRGTKAAEAAAAGVPVTAYARHSEAAKAYRRIADVLLASWGEKTPPVPETWIANG